MPGAVHPMLLPSGPFVAAVGGEGRDFAMLIAAARALPQVPFVVIARQTPLLMDPPANMTVHFNLPYATCWGIRRAGRGIAGAAARCRYVLRAYHAGQRADAGPADRHHPLARDRRIYADFAGTTLVPAGSVEGWVEAIRTVIADPDAARAAAAIDHAEAATLYDRSRWSTYIRDFVAQARA